MVTSNTRLSEPFTSETNIAHHVRRDPEGVTHVLHAMRDLGTAKNEVIYGNNRTGRWVFETLFRGTAPVYSSALALDQQGGLHAAFVGNNVLQYLKRVGGSWQTEDFSAQGPFSSESLNLSVDSHQNPTLGFATIESSSVTIRVWKKTGSLWSPLQSLANPGGVHLLRIDSQDRIHLALLDAANDQVRYVRLSLTGSIEIDAMFPAPGAVETSRCGLAIDATDRAFIAVTSLLINTETELSTELPFRFRVPALALVNGTFPYIFGHVEDDRRSPRVVIARLNRFAPPTLVGRSTNSLTWGWETVPTPPSGLNLLDSEDLENSTNIPSPEAGQYEVGSLGPNSPHRVRVRAIYPGFRLDSDDSLPAHTLALPPKSVSLSRAGDNALTISWQLNGNPVGTIYRIDAIPAAGLPITGRTSGSSWTTGSLDSNQPYALTVRSVNGDGIETSISTVDLVSRLESVREAVFALNNGLSVHIQVAGPPTAPEPAIAVLPEETDPPHLDQMTPLGVGCRVIAVPPPSPRQSVTLFIEGAEDVFHPPSGKTLVLVRYDSEHSQWISLPTTVGTRQLTARTAGVGPFHVMVRDLPIPGSETPQAVPNPFRPSEAPLLLRGLPFGARMQIVDVSGRPVREIVADAQGNAVWDGTTTGGDALSSGIYSIFWGSGIDNRIRVLLKR